MPVAPETKFAKFEGAVTGAWRIVCPKTCGICLTVISNVFLTNVMRSVREGPEWKKVE